MKKKKTILTLRAGTMWSIIFFENASSVWTTQNLDGHNFLFLLRLLLRSKNKFAKYPESSQGSYEEIRKNIPYFLWFCFPCRDYSNQLGREEPHL